MLRLRGKRLGQGCSTNNWLSWGSDARTFDATLLLKAEGMTLWQCQVGLWGPTQRDLWLLSPQPYRHYLMLPSLRSKLIYTSIPTLALIMSALEKAKQFSTPTPETQTP